LKRLLKAEEEERLEPISYFHRCLYCSKLWFSSWKSKRLFDEVDLWKFGTYLSV
jgi:hypothetical protein